MGCTSSKKEIKQVVEHWMGKEIVFPSNLTMKIYGKDTLDYSLLNHKYKILHYVDTNGCHECQCEIYVGAKGKVKLLGGSIISAGVDGYVRFDGQVACSRGGDFACTPIECKELYEIIF